jgi:hypothetical protein
MTDATSTSPSAVMVDCKRLDAVRGPGHQKPLCESLGAESGVSPAVLLDVGGGLRIAGRSSMCLVMLPVSPRNASAGQLARGPSGPYPFPQAAFGTARTDYVSAMNGGWASAAALMAALSVLLRLQVR